MRRIIADAIAKMHSFVTRLLHICAISPPPNAGNKTMRLESLQTFIVGTPPPGFGGRYFIFVRLTNIMWNHRCRRNLCRKLRP